MSKFTQLFDSLGEGFRAAKLYRTFDRMTDRQLADIGLTRGEITVKAMELARRR